MSSRSSSSVLEVWTSTQRLAGDEVRDEGDQDASAAPVLAARYGLLQSDSWKAPKRRQLLGRGECIAPPQSQPQAYIALHLMTFR
jgi:hypothetical protein